MKELPGGFKKWIWLLPTILFGSMLIFLLSSYIPADNIETALALGGITPETSSDYERQYEKRYIQSNQHLPLFYFEILPSTHHPNKRAITSKKMRNTITQYEKQGYDCSKPDQFTKDFDPAQLQKPTFFYPVFQWNGSHNQYHQYLKSLASGNWGYSRTDGLDVRKKAGQALNWTLAIVLVNFTLAIFFSLLLASTLLKKNGSKVDKFAMALFNLIYSIPGFWLATLVLIFLTGNQYGLPIFYTPLYLPMPDQQLSTILTVGFSKIAPVIFCLTVLDIALLSRLLKSKFGEEFSKPYMDVLMSRGIDQNTLIYKHALPNALLPLITILVHSLPASMAGSLVFEVVFNVPGMGRLLYESIQAADWVMMNGITLLLLVLTSFLFLVGDLLYRWADPRVK
ncbi:MAG: ABC transporter permease [Saprospiraceae bacterium]|nr:ABC transporter permease [Saprospiraceae bacterium]